LVNQIAFVLIPGRLTVEFHLCAGTNPYEEITQKVNYPLIGVFLVSIFINSIVPLLIRCYQSRQGNASLIENNSLYDLKAAFLVIFCLGVSLSFMIVSYWINLEKLNETRHHFATLFSQLISANLFPLFGSLGYLVRHKKMRLRIWQGVRENISSTYG